jgi:hypothetical protein
LQVEPQSGRNAVGNLPQDVDPAVEDESRCGMIGRNKNPHCRLTFGQRRVFTVERPLQLPRSLLGIGLGEDFIRGDPSEWLLRSQSNGECLIEPLRFHRGERGQRRGPQSIRFAGVVQEPEQPVVGSGQAICRYQRHRFGAQRVTPGEQWFQHTLHGVASGIERANGERPMFVRHAIEDRHLVPVRQAEERFLPQMLRDLRTLRELCHERRVLRTTEPVVRVENASREQV